MKLVADVGLIGHPNAGKSTLLDAITNARPKIASYAFTTIIPNLGVCEIGSSATPTTPTTSSVPTYSDSNTFSPTHTHSNSNSNSRSHDSGSNKMTFKRMVIADIPGLIEGASQGKGLGKGFLRHVERCKILIHVIDGQSQDPIGDYLAINNELQLFSSILANKPQIVVINKIDIPEVSSKLVRIMTDIKEHMSHKRLLTISAAGRIGTDELVQRTYSFLEKIVSDEQLHMASQVERPMDQNYEDPMLTIPLVGDD